MNERLTTTESLTPSALVIKQGRQLNYLRRDFSQDHGSRGTRRDDDESSQHKSPIPEVDHIREELKVMSSAELEAVANAILAAAENKAQKEASLDFYEATHGSGVLTSESDAFRKEMNKQETTEAVDSEEEPLSFYDEEIARLGYAGADALRDEIKTALGSSMRHQADRDYEGASPEDGPDYVDGISFRSRL